MPQSQTEREPAETGSPREIREAPPPEPGPHHTRNRNIAILAVIVAIILLVVFIRQRSAANTAKAAAAAASTRDRAVPVGVAPVMARDVPVYLDGLGNVNALNTVTVKTRIDGQLLRFNVQEGQVVHTGAELARIDPAPYQAPLAQADATKFKDAATLENARHDLQR